MPRGPPKLFSGSEEQTDFCTISSYSNLKSKGDDSHLYTDYFKRAMIIIYDLSNLFIRVSNKRKVSGIHLTHRVPWFAPLPPNIWGQFKFWIVVLNTSNLSDHLGANQSSCFLLNYLRCLWCSLFLEILNLHCFFLNYLTVMTVGLFLVLVPLRDFFLKIA